MKRFIAIIALASFCFLSGCNLFTPEQEQAGEIRYDSIRVDTNPDEPMLYILNVNDNWYSGLIVVDENWNIVFDDAEIADYLVDQLKPAGTPESVVGMRIETVDEKGNAVTKIVDKTGRQLGGLDGYNISYNIKDGHIVVYYYAGDNWDFYAGLYDIASETIVMPIQMCDRIEILDEGVVFLKDNDGCRLVDYRGELICELPGVGYVETYGYDGSGLLVASKSSDSWYDKLGLIDLEGNWITEANYKEINGRFFGKYTLASKEAPEYGEYGSECVLLDSSGVEYELDIPRVNDWYYFYTMKEFAVVNVPGYGMYIVKADRSVEKVGDGWGSAIALGGGALIEVDEGVIVTDHSGNRIDFMERMGISYYMWYSDKYVCLYDHFTYAKSLYIHTGSELVKLDVSDVLDITPDGRFFSCANSSAAGLKDMDGNWVYKEYLFNYLTD